MAAALVLFERRRGILLAAGATLLAFPGILTLLLLDRHAPGCGCFGPVSRGREDIPLGLVRNGAAIVLIIWLARKEANHGGQAENPITIRGVHAD